ncbi:MAG: 30S ribosomal protein S3 [Candidatus Bostrichicola ureolyticus]|nr:MAG: 30S ribosomal protein S3 [Candidatus Bostrichicola ureolyticus]
MGQKTNPIANRLGIILSWQSSWCGDFLERITEDFKIRHYIEKRLPKYIVSRIFIERTLKFITITIYTSRPAIIIGKGGHEIDKLKNELSKITTKEMQINVNDIKRPELDASLVAKNLARYIENRFSYKRIIKQAIISAMRLSAEGIKIQVSGRLNGVEMARKESYKEGSISLSTFRVNIDYAMVEAHTIYGRIGIKVWINKGEIYNKKEFLIVGGGGKR